MGDATREEADAFFDFLSTFTLSRPATTIADLSDGAALFDVLSIVDQDYFRQPSRPSAQLSDNWVLRFASLKRLYRLITQYFADVLHQPTSTLDVPDLQAVAKGHDEAATLILCRLTIAIAVQSKKNKDVIDRIQQLNEAKQHILMKAIEQVMSKFNAVMSDRHAGDSSMTDDDHYYQIQSERSRILSEKETLEKVYQQLLDDHRILQTSYDDAVSEKEDVVARLRDAQRTKDGHRNDKSDLLMRAEIDRLRTELQKSEDNLSMTEAELDKHTVLVTDLTRKVDELQVKADQAARLKDQVDEYRHAADKLQKTENVMEKYKKKLEESADLRRSIKALEEQNASLVDKNAALEEEYRKVAAFRPLMESYKTQISDLEAKNSNRTKEMDALKFELEQARTRLRIAAEERAKDSEALELYQERVRELELTSTRRPRATSTSSVVGSGDAVKHREMTEAELLGENDDLADGQGLGGELDDALTGTTMTDLKLQVRQLKRDLEAAKTNQADSSRVLILENLLEDANRMKARYEADYLAAHREKLVLQNDLEEIREGKTLGDGAETAIALRQRLNETVEALDSLKKEHTELEVKFESQSKELTIAKSDLNLVNKDQLEILATLRESVNEDKLGLESETEKLRKQIRDLSDKNKMQLEQVNALLLEKVNLQSDGIGQRERMLERERDYGNLRASLKGRDLPEEEKARMLEMHEKAVRTEEELKTTKEQLLKARAFIKNQDKLFREREEATKFNLPSTFEEAEASFRSQIKILEEDNLRAKRLLVEARHRYRKEQQLMLGAIHVMGLHQARGHLSNAPQRQEKGAWLPGLRPQIVGLHR
ncbi:HOOK-domain-containing protein [Hysterangium stoloniferum]|nr:HOOK-domain-containing protein [Hysterangium stoloniferum]